MILTAVFALKGGLITGDATLLLKHLAAAVLVAVYTFGVSALLYRVVGFIGSLSASNVLSRDGAAFDLDLGDMEGIL
ncbi:MAG: ammonia channel protein, partial [Proteobacteria bacterium]|nr:ammonia channel protein [Pseudomonadota bacterium]